MSKRFSHGFLVKSATLSAVCVAIVLILGKAYAYFITGALSIQASLIDSVLDGCVSCVNYFAVKQALEPADEDHRFGHGKFEALAGLLQSIFIALSALFLLKEVVTHLLHPTSIPYHSNAVTVMIFSTLLTVFLVMWQRYVIKQTESIAIKADSLHYESDLYSNVGVLLSFFVASTFHFAYVDAITAALIAIYIFKTSFEIGKTSFDVLMDRELPDHVVHAIKNIATMHPMVLNLHDLRTRSSGQREFIQMHIEVDGSLPLTKAHAIAEEIELSVIKTFPKADVIIHQDPASS
jgi:ferrous-iron efflux pump FieF